LPELQGTKTQKTKSIPDNADIFVADTLKGGAKKPELAKVWTCWPAQKVRGTWLKHGMFVREISSGYEDM